MVGASPPSAVSRWWSTFTRRRRPPVARPRPAACAIVAPTTSRRAPSCWDIPDPVAKVKKFHDKEGLNFVLLADEGHAVAERYGIWVTKSMYGRKYLGNERTTFIIDSAGKVAEVLRKVKPAEHDDLVLKASGRAARPSA